MDLYLEIASRCAIVFIFNKSRDRVFNFKKINLLKDNYIKPHENISSFLVLHIQQTQ